MGGDPHVRWSERRPDIRMVPTLTHVLVPRARRSRWCVQDPLHLVAQADAVSIVWSSVTAGDMKDHIIELCNSELARQTAEKASEESSAPLDTPLVRGYNFLRESKSLRGEIATDVSPPRTTGSLLPTGSDLYTSSAAICNCLGGNSQARLLAGSTDSSHRLLGVSPPLSSPDS